MVLLAISILIGQAVKRPDMRPKWAGQPTNSVVSSGWQTEARRADAEIQTLRSSSQQRRAEVFRTLQSEMRRQMYSPNMKVDPKLVYRGARLSLAFHPETKSKESVFEYACDYFPGSRDPEFRRAVVLVL